jgi:hypothetical protein
MNVKNVWTDSDFNEMGWHDCRLYSVIIPGEDFKLKFNLDYIFDVEKKENEFKGFWVAPCDLYFLDIVGLKINIDFKDNMLLFISDIRRFNSRPAPNPEVIIWDYEIECDNGDISFSATGFRQELISQPILSETYDLNRTL